MEIQTKIELFALVANDFGRMHVGWPSPDPQFTARSARYKKDLPASIMMKQLELITANELV